jgi:hypothetical protein
MGRERCPRGPRAWSGWPFLLIFLALASFPAPASAQELGRLFFTPEHREMLDRQRELDLPERQEIEEEDPPLTVDGVVTRSSGRRTVWINGVARDGDEAAVTPDRVHPGRIVVRTADGSSAQASVGDTVNRSTGETTDLLGGGRILIRTVPSLR